MLQFAYLSLNRLFSTVSKKTKKLETVKFSESSYSFRLQGKIFLLTYPQVGEAVLKDFIDKLVEKTNALYSVESYTASCELHKDKGRHFHVCITFKNRINTTNTSFFDVDGLHPNIQTVRNKQKALTYVLKDIPPGSSPGLDVLYTSFDVKDIAHLFGIHDKEKKSKSNKKIVNPEVFKNVYTKILTNPKFSLLEGMNDLVVADPILTLKNYKQIYSNLTFIKMQHASHSSSYIDYFRFDFHFTPLIFGWMLQYSSTHTLCLMGSTRAGKSTLALQLGGAHPLVINEINGLAHLIVGHHTSIIFNDFDFKDSSITLSKLLSIFDLKTPSTVRILFQSISLPAYIPRIITSNHDLRDHFKGEAAVKSRLLFAYVPRLIRIDRTSYDVYLPSLIPCTYDENKKLLPGKPNCLTSVSLFSFFSAVKRNLLIEKNHETFLRIFPVSLTSLQLSLLKSLDRMYLTLKDRYPESYTFVNIYHVLQHYMVLNRPEFDFGSFIFRCYHLYKHYEFERSTPKVNTPCNVFDLIYANRSIPLDKIDFNKVGHQTKSVSVITKEGEDDALLSYEPDPFFSSLKPNKSIAQTPKAGFSGLYSKVPHSKTRLNFDINDSSSDLSSVLPKTSSDQIDSFSSENIFPKDDS